MKDTYQKMLSFISSWDQTSCSNIVLTPKKSPIDALNSMNEFCFTIYYFPFFYGNNTNGYIFKKIVLNNDRHLEVITTF